MTTEETSTTITETKETIQTIECKKDQIMIGYYVDLSPRFYKVISVTPCKVRLLRLREKDSLLKDRFGNKILLPGSDGPYKNFMATKKKDYLIHNGEKIIPFNKDDYVTGLTRQNYLM